MKNSIKNQHKVFGIRHHGPGCANHLSHALDEYQPDCILIECPEEAQLALDSLVPPEINLPAAILLYRPDNNDHNMILPLTEFSPEWVAIQYAKSHTLPLKAIDLPLGALIDNPDELSTVNIPTQNFLPIRNTSEAFEYLAQLQGIHDVDLWWEINFEAIQYDAGFFEKINELMEGIRPAIEAGSTKGNRMREAWMRRHIRKAIKAGFNKIAVVCGAAHAPFLSDVDTLNEMNDATMTNETTIQPMLTTWIPWSYHKISSLNQYGAGVPYPLFYEHLFRYKEKATITITAALTLYLRAKGYDISPAHTIEAVNLSQTLAQMRGFDQPGIHIIIEACNAVYNLDAKGFDRQLIEEAFIGEKTGKVPINTANQALIADFEKLVKQFNLQAHMNKTGPQELVLDLRDEKAHGASILLWQLLLLEIPWGTPSDPFKTTKGTFNEYWVLHWQSDYMIMLYHLIMYGTTIASAAQAKTEELLKDKNGPGLFLKMFKPIINAQIPKLTDTLTTKIQNTIFESNDMEEWLELLPDLISVTNFGSVRELDTTKITEISREILDKVIVNLPNVLAILHSENVDSFLKKMKKVQHALYLHVEKIEYNKYILLIDQVTNLHSIPAQIRGWISGVSMEAGQITTDVMLNRLSFELSDIDQADNAAQWLDGMLATQVFTALEIPDILSILNDWLTFIHYEQFRNILPALRKAFAQLPLKTREQLMAFVQGGRVSSLHQNKMIQLDPELAAIFKKNIDWIVQSPNE